MRSVPGWNVGDPLLSSELLEWLCSRILLLRIDAVRLLWKG